MNDKFGKGYFDGGKEEPGVYKSYRYEDFYPRFKALTTIIKNRFNPTRVLDVGCAKGFLVKAFKDMGIQVYGVDTSGYAISNAPSDVKAYLFDMDLNKDYLPFREEYFDFVTFFGTIEYLDNHTHVIKEINRVLKLGGMVFFVTTYERNPADRIRSNIHSRDYWIKEFESEEFRLLGNEGDIFKEQFFKEKLERIFATTKRSTLRFNVAKLLYGYLGNFGKKVVFLLYKRIIACDSACFLFVKGGANSDPCMCTIPE